MQVNNTVSTNFGMALRIKNPKQTAKALKELPLPVVEKYADAADKLKGTTFYHLQVDSDLKPVILGKQGSYWGPIVSEKAAKKAAYQAEKRAVENTVNKLVNRFSINA